MAQAMRLRSGPAVTPHDPEEVQGARRYARLLVSEIKLYHEGAVDEGRRAGDLRARLAAQDTWSLLVIFQAKLTTLIQLYIIGVFTSFSIGQWGMVRHWKRELGAERDPQIRRRMRRSPRIPIGRCPRHCLRDPAGGQAGDASRRLRARWAGRQAGDPRRRWQVGSGLHLRKAAVESEPRLQEEREKDPAVRTMLEIGMKLEGLYRHASTHAAGVVAAVRPTRVGSRPAPTLSASPLATICSEAKSRITSSIPRRTEPSSASRVVSRLFSTSDVMISTTDLPRSVENDGSLSRRRSANSTEQPPENTDSRRNTSCSS